MPNETVEGVIEFARLPLVDPRRNRLIPATSGVAVRARARLAERNEFEASADTVLEDHLDVRLTIDLDRFDVMLGHTTSVGAGPGYRSTW